MANGRVFRGEVYWVCLDDSKGSEQMTGRPAVIISGNGANEKMDTVIVAYLTSQWKYGTSAVPVLVNGEKNFVMCNQLRTVSRQRLIKYVCTLSVEEMKRVGGGLAIAVCVPQSSVTTPKPENTDKTALQVERDTYKLLYEKVLEQLVDLKLNADLNEKMDQSEPEEESEEEEFVVEFEPEPELVEINTCEIEDLTRLGFSLKVANDIIVNRPYMDITDLKKLNSVTGIMYQLVERKICCVEVEVEEPEPVADDEEEELTPEPEEVVEFTGKVNINVATAKEMSELLGLPLKDAYAITGYRNKNGLFVALEELLEVSRISKPKFEKIKDRVTIGEEEVDDPEPDEEYDEPNVEVEAAKVNVNEANIHALMRTGLGKPEAARVAAWVKKYGKFKSVDDLIKVDGITGKVLRKIRDKLEV